MDPTANTTSSEYDSPTPKPGDRTPVGWYQHWNKELDACDRRLRAYRKRGTQIVHRYQGMHSGSGNSNAAYGGDYARDTIGNGPALLNLFHTNVSTKMAMLCGQKPKTDVAREHADPNDDDARVAALIIQRMLDSDNYPSGKDLKSTLAAALQDRLLPGTGVARVRYTYATEKQTVPGIGGAPEQEMEVTTWEDAPLDYVHWQDCAWGWCRSWEELPWWGFRSWMDKHEVRKRGWGWAVSQMEWQKQSPSGDTKYDAQASDDRKSSVQKAEIWEIWDKRSRKQFFYSPGVGRTLEANDDPLKLDDFWPLPRPMFANLTTTLLEPTADFMLAQDLYNQIDLLQTRIVILTSAVKAVGVYDASSSEAVGRMLIEANENEAIPVDNWAMHAEKGGLQGVIEWFPVEDVVTTLSKLQQVRSETIQLLYEVTGMSDLIRGGNTDQYTAADTNRMTAKFGSIRIQHVQDDFARFASELQALKAEVIAKHFKPQSILQQSNARYLPLPDQQRLNNALQLIKSPESKMRIDIKPESIAMMDLQQEQAERVELITAVSTYIQSTQAAAKEMPRALPMLVEILKWGMASFKGADYLEGMFDQILEDLKNNPPGQQGDQQAQAQQMETQAKLQLQQMKLQETQIKLQGELQKIQAKAQADLMTLRMKNQGEMAKLMADQKGDMTLQQQQHMASMREIDRELATRLEEIAAELAADLQREEMQSRMAIAEEEVEHDNTMTQLAYQARQQETPDASA